MEILQLFWATCADGRAGGIKEGPHCPNQAFLFLVILAKKKKIKFQEKTL